MKMVLSFKVDSRIKDALQKLADEENRSLSNYIVTVLIRHLEKLGIHYKNPSKAPK
jgi:predicted transcriptional regulator